MKPSQIVATLPSLIQTNHSLFIWGPPGVGKSDIVRNLTNALGIGCVDLRLSLFDPTDLKGYPVVVGTGSKQTMQFVPPGLLPTKGKGILFLDELPGAPPSVQTAAYQLVLDRKLGTYTLPDGWHIIAAGNRAADGGVHYTMPPALANRFIHFTMEADQGDWDKWAAANHVDATLRAFLRFRPALIHDMGARKAGVAFPTPRSWVMAANVLTQSHTPLVELELLTGVVGEGAATELLAFVKNARGLPSIHEILINPTNAPVPAEPGAKHAVTTLLESNASKTNFKQCLEYVIRLEPEYQVAFIHGITTNQHDLTATAEYVNWCVENQNLLGIGE